MCNIYKCLSQENGPDVGITVSWISLFHWKKIILETHKLYFIYPYFQYEFNKFSARQLMQNYNDADRL